MAKTTTAKMGGSVRRQGRRVMPALRRSVQRVKPSKKQTAPLTVGELIAAAFDTAGGEIAEVLKVVTSPQLSKALGRRIVVVP
ncbi:hypothetical protein [Stigmatella aurantiaca]|uniref:Conserved uncharacterized protein n=1 Tax=Stigmatella aurantiaca (strain DW4/3-1) TaxID=378806 RepID=Q08VH9_STIAD|nr:hypothetical protein [Stigmatella aurantiaca]ADO70596.1 conserved uncharacterized protein [Stigmatella aurantiaca DW4/3-1]EAU64492.1 hypothetical protein STIAU_4113 [Stigmatella aurantiaca DW4/3-1]